MRPWLLTFDVVAVLLFVVIGRDTHNEANTVTAILETAAPFIIAVGAGWAVARAWMSPSSLRTGFVVLAVTLVGGLALRRFAFGDGTATPFVLVTAGFFVITMLGWRLLADAAVRRSTR